MSTGEWMATLPCDQYAYIEYCYVRDGRQEPDPLNSRHVKSGTGDMHSVASMPGWRPTELTRRRQGVARGVLTKHKVRTRIGSLAELGMLPCGHRLEIRRPPWWSSWMVRITFATPGCLQS